VSPVDWTLNLPNEAEDMFGYAFPQKQEEKKSTLKWLHDVRNHEMQEKALSTGERGE